ncbi:MAG: aspartate kinase [Gemmataceae bacterium]|nr:aspartate kinase [Gemmataceae bacterium]
MGLVVQKFGGTSVATAERIKAAARKAIRALQAGNQVLVVVSARGDTTDDLIEMAREITDNPPAREMDMLLSTGEQISIALLAMAIQSMGAMAISYTGAQVGIVTDSSHTKARIRSIHSAKMRQSLDEGKIVIVAGFQGTDDEGNITTLGRGGSDTTAVALAAVLKQEGGPDKGVQCEIYTDVDGIYTTDPRLVPEARKMEAISYDEMLELASVGAGVMHSRSIEFAKKFDVPLMVRSSFSDAEGTWIIPEQSWMTQNPVCGAAIIKDEARIAVEDVPDTPGISHRIFTAIAAQAIVVDMIAQNPSTKGRASIGFTVPAGDLKKTLALLDPIAREMGARVEHDGQVSKVSLVGAGMRVHTGVAERMFAALSREKINLRMITTGDIKISVLVDKQDGLRALRLVHHAFDLDKRAVTVPPKIIPDQNPNPLSCEKKATLLTQRLANMEGIMVSDIEHQTDQGRVAIYGLPDAPGYCSQVFEAVAAAGIVVDMIVQNHSRGFADLSFSVPLSELERAKSVTNSLMAKIAPDCRVESENGLATIHVIGVGMRSHTGVASAVFGALARNSINILMINNSEIRLSVVVDRAKVQEAGRCLREEFGLVSPA